MRRPLGAFLIVSAILAAGVAGLAVGRSNGPLPATTTPGAVRSEATGPTIYYRDPDGLPNYSLTPKKTASGKDYSPVRASEDVSFEEKAPEVMTAKGGDRGKIRFYR